VLIHYAVGGDKVRVCVLHSARPAHMSARAAGVAVHVSVWEDV
jgi:hypothetical protein